MRHTTIKSFTANRFHQECYYDMLQGFGMHSAGLQKGLLQSIAPDAGGEPVIHVFPAWDVAKPADFRMSLPVANPIPK